MELRGGDAELLLVIVAIGLVVGSTIFFRHHEKELEQRAERAIPGPLIDAPASARDVADSGSRSECNWPRS